MFNSKAFFFVYMIRKNCCFRRPHHDCIYIILILRSFSLIKESFFFIPIHSGRLHLKPFCQNENMSENSMLTYRALLGFLQYLTPLSIISCVYTRMGLKLWGNRAPGNAQDLRDANLMKNKIKVSSSY